MVPTPSDKEPLPSFEAPNTEEVNFDYPIHDDATLDSELIELPNEPELPSLEHAHPMIEVEAPSFASAPDPTEAPDLTDPPAFQDDHALVDFPTEEELTLPEEDNDPLGNEAFASLDASWDEDEDDDLAWVNDKKRGRRIAAGLLLAVLLLLTTKLFMDRRAEEDPVPEGPETIALAELPEEAIEVIDENDEPAEGPSENATAEEEPPAEEPPAVRKPEAAPTPAASPRRKSANSSEPESTPSQRQLTQKAREAQTRRGPQPTTAADFVDRGRQAISEGDYNAARLYYLDAVDMEPQNAAANQGLAFAALQQGDTPFAIRHFCTTLSLTSPTSSMAQETRRALEDLNAECP
jgi:outer membrane biosynthesis protein TonB